MERKLKHETSWGNVANWYDEALEKSDSYQKELILPNLLRIINPKKGSRILDLGCGQGFFSLEFAKKGAEVTGVDIAKELLDIAKENAVKAHVSNAEYILSSAEQLPVKAKSANFGIVVSVLAIQNMENISQVFGESAKALKQNGRLVVVLNHPAFRIPKKSSWGFDEKNKIQYRRVDEYISESRSEINMRPGKADSPKTISFHRSLQIYSKTLANSGFAILRMEEWVSNKKSESGPRQKAEDKARKEFPLFMCIEAIKL